MLIDWFTVVAMIINFLILVWLLKRFLYQPILRAIDKREKHIADELEQAAKTKLEAEQLGEQYRQKNEDFDRKQVERTLEMKDEIERERQRLLADVRQSVQLLRDNQEAVLQREVREFEQGFRRRMSESVALASGKVLKDLSDESLQERMLDVFIERLAGLDQDDLAKMHPAAGEPEPIIVSTAFPLDPSRRNQLEATVGEDLSASAPIRFDTDDRLVCGIAVTWGSYRIAWNLADYLESLQKNLESLVNLQRPSDETR